MPDCVVKEKFLKTKELLSETDHIKALMQIGVSGYVPETVSAAFYCLCSTDTFRDAVVMAVKAGGDTDTTAAVCGSLAGTLYGLEGIDDEYKVVEDFHLFNELTEKLLLIGKEN